MKEFNIDCWEVIESYDRDVRHIAYTDSESLAHLLTNQSKGYRSYHKYKRNIVIFSTIDEIEENSKANLIKNGISKLSPKEISALGLDKFLR